LTVQSDSGAEKGKLPGDIVAWLNMGDLWRQTDAAEQEGIRVIPKETDIAFFISIFRFVMLR
jgi:hypothetical protein